MNEFLGGMVGFEFENAYKLQRVAQWKALGILRIDVLRYQEHMNHENFEVLIVSSVFETLPKETQDILIRMMSKTKGAARALCR